MNQFELKTVSPKSAIRWVVTLAQLEKKYGQIKEVPIQDRWNIIVNTSKGAYKFRRISKLHRVSSKNVIFHTCSILYMVNENKMTFGGKSPNIAPANMSDVRLKILKKIIFIFMAFCRLKSTYSNAFTWISITLQSFSLISNEYFRYRCEFGLVRFWSTSDCSDATSISQWLAMPLM